MRAERGTLLLWLLLISAALQAAPGDSDDDLAFLEFLALMIEDGDDWIDPLTAGKALSGTTEDGQQQVPGSEQPSTSQTPDATTPRHYREPAP